MLTSSSGGSLYSMRSTPGLFGYLFTPAKASIHPAAVADDPVKVYVHSNDPNQRAWPLKEYFVGDAKSNISPYVLSVCLNSVLGLVARTIYGVYALLEYHIAIDVKLLLCVVQRGNNTGYKGDLRFSFVGDMTNESRRLFRIDETTGYVYLRDFQKDLLTEKALLEKDDYLQNDIFQEDFYQWDTIHTINVVSYLLSSDKLGYWKELEQPKPCAAYKKHAAYEIEVLRVGGLLRMR